MLRAGALPAPLKIIQDLTVGPSLGKDSIEKGVQATLIAGAMVIGFMVVYYRLSGVVADFALVLNLICLMGALVGAERDAHVARHCRHRADDRDGRRFQRADLRTDPGRTPGRERRSDWRSMEATTKRC